MSAVRARNVRNRRSSSCTARNRPGRVTLFELSSDRGKHRNCRKTERLAGGPWTSGGSSGCWIILHGGTGQAPCRPVEPSASTKIVYDAGSERINGLRGRVLAPRRTVRAGRAEQCSSVEPHGEQVARATASRRYINPGGRDGDDGHEQDTEASEHSTRSR